MAIMAIKWMLKKARSIAICALVYFMLPRVIDLMSDTLKHIVDGVATPKAIGGAAGTGWFTTLLAQVNHAAPNILVYLSIFATILTIWAYFANRKRQKAKDELERHESIVRNEAVKADQARKAEDDRRKEEVHRAQMEKLEAEKQEAETRAEAQTLFSELMIKKQPDNAENLIEQMADKVINMADKKKST